MSSYSRHHESALLAQSGHPEANARKRSDQSYSLNILTARVAPSVRTAILRIVFVGISPVSAWRTAD